MAICKSFVRPPLDYGDIIYDQLNSFAFHQKLESFQYYQYYTDLAVKGTIGEAPEENTAQTINFSIKDFFSKCDRIHSFLWICLYLLKKFLMENFIFLCSGNSSQRQFRKVCSFF